MKKVKTIAGNVFLIIFGIFAFVIFYGAIFNVINHNPEFIAFIITATLMYLIIKFIRS